MIPRNNSERYRKAVIEQTLLRRNFPFLNSRISGLELVCGGKITPTADSQTYKIEIRYCAPGSPEVRVLRPAITFDSRIHMYKNDTLCLYDYRNQPWQENWHLHDTIVPWTAEWLVFYELFLETGKWLGKSASHS